MMNREESLRWLRQRTEEYRSGKNDICDLVEDFDDMRNLGQGFSSVDEPDEVYLGADVAARPTFVSRKLDGDQRNEGRLSHCYLLYG